MKKLRNIHPGEVLSEEFLKPLNISLKEISKETGISLARVNAIVKGLKPVDASVALHFAKYFGNTPKFWLGLQDDFDIEEESKRNHKAIMSIRGFNRNAA